MLKSLAEPCNHSSAAEDRLPPQKNRSLYCGDRRPRLRRGARRGNILYEIGSKLQRQSRVFQTNDEGAALVIVLALVVLFTGLSVAYFSRTTRDREVAHSSFNQTRADQLGLSAVDLIVSDFKQEIINGSTTAQDYAGATMYIPNSSLNVVPQTSGKPPLIAGVDPIPNLIRRSVYPETIVTPSVGSRASNVNSTSPSSNRRTISPTRWNSHYLIPKINTTDDSIPVTDFIAPDWVIVTRNGPVSFSDWNVALKDSAATNLDYAVGRYAYAVYDEGGLLDINLAGYPTNNASGPMPSISDIGRKGIVAFADLTALQTKPSSSYVSNTVIDRIVGWRNYQTMQLTGKFPGSLSFPSSAITNFATYFLGSSRTGTTVDFGFVANTGTTRTDQSFLSRKELIKLRSDTQAGAASMLQYLVTFSREQNMPTWRYGSFSKSTAYPLSNRFALSKIAQVTSGANIQASFGLEWASDHWQYVGTSGSTVQQSITPPTAGTAPDFFQILSFARTSPTGVAPSILETLSIGASIIDQYDTDSVTTKIEYAVPTGQGDKTSAAYAYGMESATPPVPADAPASAPASAMLNRALRNVGELGYAFKNTSATADFRTTNNVDAGLLDFFTYNTATPRSGTINLNTHNSSVLAAILMGTLAKESSSTGVSRANAIAAANSIVAETTNTSAGHGPVVSRADVTRLASAAVVTTSPFNADEESRESIARALAEVGQTRTWGLLIDVIAQAGRYSPVANALADFTVEGEQRYWVHVAIDRFTGQVIDRQIEVVSE